jgi:hypothetical protein
MIVLPFALMLAAADTLALPPADPAGLPVARVTVDTKTKEIRVDLPGIPLPAHTGHHGGGGGYPPVVRFEFPLDASLYGFRVEILDKNGNKLPDGLLHHFNLIDPDNRELFLPISRRIMASGKETGAQQRPWLLFGLPTKKGALLVASAMLHNPTDTDYDEAVTRLVLQYTPAGRPWPFWEGTAFQLDVGFPVGDKSFTLPPGVSARSYEASPAVAGKIVAVGGHVHELATRIELIDVAENKLIWSAEPTVDAEQNVVGVPIGKLYRLGSLGYPVRTDRAYRVTVHYDNTTGAPVEAGGMGVVGGLFVPDRGQAWPVANKAEALYQTDARHYLRVKAKVDSVAPEHVHDH